MSIAIGSYMPVTMPVRTRSGQIFNACEGMEVVGADGRLVGRVKQISRSDVLVDRALHRDVYVPFEAIRTVINNQIVLTIAADQVDGMHWPHPDLF